MSGADLDELRTGAVLGGKYQIVRTLGEGGMAVVLEAEHTRLGHKVAIKVMLPAVAAHPAMVARFEREGRALSNLKSRNVVRVVDVDATPSGCPYLVMEYLDGVDLGQELAARGPLPVGEAVEYVLQACEGMREAHAQGIVHRDLKPTNLFLTSEGAARVVKVLDFGIATEGPMDVEARLTKTETVMGTPSYMAPEQFRSAKGVDERVDIWALGTTLYELLTGDPPFVGTATSVGVSIVTDPVRPMELSRDDIPPGLRDVVLKALEKDRDRRFATMTELATALEPFGDGLVRATRGVGRVSIPDIENAQTLAAVSAPPMTVPAATAPATAPATSAAMTQELTEARPKSTRPWWPAALVAIPVLGAAVFALLPHRSNAPAAASLPALPVTTVSSVPATASPPAPVVSAEPTPTASAAEPAVAHGTPIAHASARPTDSPRTAGATAPRGTTKAPPPPGGNPLFFPQ